MSQVCFHSHQPALIGVIFPRTGFLGDSCDNAIIVRIRLLNTCPGIISWRYKHSDNRMCLLNILYTLPTDGIYLKYHCCQNRGYSLQTKIMCQALKCTKELLRNKHADFHSLLLILLRLLQNPF